MEHISLEDFKNGLLRDDGDHCRDWDYFIIHGERDYSFAGKPIEFIEKQGGGEGGGEYCYTVLKIGDAFYKIEYSYYSYNGYEFYEGFSLVTPKEKTITVYE